MKPINFKRRPKQAPHNRPTPYKVPHIHDPLVELETEDTCAALEHGFNLLAGLDADDDVTDQLLRQIDLTGTFAD